MNDYKYDMHALDSIEVLGQPTIIQYDNNTPCNVQLVVGHSVVLLGRTGQGVIGLKQCQRLFHHPESGEEHNLCTGRDKTLSMRRAIFIFSS